MLGFGMLIPDIALRAEAFGADGRTIGIVQSSMFVVQILVSPLWGRASDRLGRKGVFMACTGLSACSMLVYGAASSVWWLLASRIVSGLGAANVAVAQASVSDITTTEDRTPALGRMSAALTTGLIMGPALGGWLSATFGSALLGYIGAAASGLGVLCVGFAVRKSARVAVDTSKSWGNFAFLRENKAVVPLVAMAAVAWFALSCLEGTFGRLIKHSLGYGAREFGMIFSYESVIGLFVQAVALKWLIDRVPERRLLWVSFLLQGVGLAVTPLAPHLGFLFLASTFYAFGQGVANPTVSGMASKQVTEERQGELFGVMQSARSVGFVFGPSLGGILFDINRAAPYYMAGVVCAVTALLVAWSPWGLRKPSPAA